MQSTVSYCRGWGGKNPVTLTTEEGQMLMWPSEELSSTSFVFQYCYYFYIVMWLQLWVLILQIKPAGLFLKVYVVNMQVLIHVHFTKAFKPGNSLQCVLCPAKSQRMSEVKELSKFSGSGWVTCMGSSCSSKPVQRGNAMVIADFILLAWVPAVSRKFYKILFGVMVPVRTNRAVMLSKAQINICWHSLNTQISIWEIPLDDRVDEGSSDFRHISAIYKKRHTIYGHYSLWEDIDSFCCSPLLILVTHFIPPLQHLTLEDHQSVVPIHISSENLEWERLTDGARNSWLS